MKDIIPREQPTPPAIAGCIGPRESDDSGRVERGSRSKATGDARLGAMLKAMRHADGRGLKEAAHACGVTVSAMSAYERGEALPSVPVLARLSCYYGVSADRLIRHLGDDPAA